jgi:hypothetical protein
MRVKNKCSRAVTGKRLAQMPLHGGLLDLQQPQRPSRFWRSHDVVTQQLGDLNALRTGRVFTYAKTILRTWERVR